MTAYGNYGMIVECVAWNRMGLLLLVMIMDNNMTARLGIQEYGPIGRGWLPFGVVKPAGANHGSVLYLPVWLECVIAAFVVHESMSAFVAGMQ